MNSNIAITIAALSLSACSSIGGYSESYTETKVNFSEYNAQTNDFLKKQTRLKVAQTGLVSGSTLIYSAQGSSSANSTDKNSFNITYSLWINESEIEDVEYAIDKYRQWQKQETPDKYLLTLPINEYVSEWMNGVTFRFGLHSTTHGKDFLRVCYEFSASGTCTFTYMIDEQSVELLSNDLQKFKLHAFQLGS